VERDDVTYLDTHVVVLLFGGEAQRLSIAAVAQIQAEEVLVSPAVARRSHDCERGTHECVRHGASASIVK
jgi:hypothetical protein